MESIRVLVVEDDQDINNLLCTILRDGGYESQAAFSGSEGLLWAERENFDLVLLDLMLPGLTGEQFIQKIRPLRTMPIIVLSAKAGLEDKVNVLRMGADDFIPKPFQLRRVKKFSASPAQKQQLSCGDLLLDRDEFTVTAGGKPVTLTAREFEILALLMEYPKKVFTREQIYQHVWGEDYFGDDNTVNVHISNLRSKLGKAISRPSGASALKWRRCEFHGYPCERRAEDEKGPPLREPGVARPPGGHGL